MIDTYLIEVVESHEPKLLGPFHGHVDTTTPLAWIREQGWVRAKGDNPNWVRGNDKLYRVTADGIVRLIEAVNTAGLALRNSYHGYFQDHHRGG